MNLNESINRQCEDYFKRYGQKTSVVNAEGRETKEIKAILKEINENKEDKFDEKYLITPENQIKQGEVIKSLNEYWLVMQKPFLYKRYEKAIVRKADPINFIVNKKPFAVASCINTKVLGVDTADMVQFVSGRIEVIIPNNMVTKNLITGQRFLKSNYGEPNAYKIIGIDSYSDGLLILTCDKALIRPDDDIINQYAEFTIIPHSYTIENKSGKNISLKNGDALQLYLIAKDNGEIVENPIIKYSTNVENVITINDKGLITATGVGVCIITIEYEGINEVININIEEVILDNYTLELSSANGKYEVLQSEGKQTCNAVIKNNGIEVGQEVYNNLKFTLVNVSTYKETLAKIIEYNNNKAVTFQTIKNTGTSGLLIKIIAELNYNSINIKQEKSFKIRGFF